MDPAAHRLGSALCIASAIAFGAMAIFGKLAYDAGVGILTLLFVRFSIAAPVLWLGALQRRRARLLGRDRAGRCWPRSRSAPSATRCRPGCTSPRSRGWTPRCCRCCSTRSPRWSTVAAIALGRETASRRRTGALLVSSGGLALVLLGAGAGTFDWLGAALGLGAALTYTAYILVSDRVGGELRGAAAVGADHHGRGDHVRRRRAPPAARSTPASRARAGCGWRRSRSSRRSRRSRSSSPGCGASGPSTASILSTLEPLTTVALAFVVFGETLSARPAGRRRARARRRRLRCSCRPRGPRAGAAAA